MKRVAIVGVGMTPRTRAYMRGADRRSYKEYVADAAYAAIADARKGLDPKDIQYVVVNYHGEATVEAGGIGPVISDVLGLHPVGVTALCANCVGAGVSTHDAWGLVASGRYDRVLVIGFDKRWEVINFGDKRAIGGDVDYDFGFGFDHPQLQALLQAMYYKRYGRRKVLEALAMYRVQMCWWGSRNPNSALYGMQCLVTKDELMAIVDRRSESDPVDPEFWARLPGSCAVEGASAMLLVPAEEAKAYTDKPIYMDGVAYKCNSHLLSNQMYYPIADLAGYDAGDFASAQVAAAEAYEAAGVTPDDVDLAEIFESHVTSLVPTLQATQVPAPGEALQFVLDGQTGIDGRLPTGTDGGRGGLGLTSGSNFSDGIYEAVVQMR